MNPEAERIPEYTELERQRIKERWEKLTPKQKRAVHTAFLQMNAPKLEPVKPLVPVVSYKQLAQNWKDKPAKEVAKRIRFLNKDLNSKKDQLRVVNKPGSVHTDENGDSYMITKKGTSVYIGKAKK